MKVLKECIRLRPDDATIPLLAAKLCMGSLHWVSAREPFSVIAGRRGGCSSPGLLAWAPGLLRPQLPPQGLRGISKTPGASFSWECASKVEMVRENWNGTQMRPVRKSHRTRKRWSLSGSLLAELFCKAESHPLL